MNRLWSVLALTVLAACGGGGDATPSVTEAWRWSAPRPAYVGMPASKGDDVAATYGHAVLVLLDAPTGRVRWRAERVGLRDTAPTITGDRVLAATDDGVAAFARSDGRRLWEQSLGDRASTPIVVGDRVVVTTWDGRLVAVDGWTVTMPGPSLGPPATAEGVVVASWDSGMLGVDAATGRVLWTREFEGTGTSAPAAGRGVAVVVGGDRRVRALDLRSGRERWSRPMVGAGSPEAPPALRGGLVAVADRLGHVAVIDLATGRHRWSADGKGAVVRGGPVFAGEVVAFPIDDGRLLVATKRSHTFRDPPGRVSGIAAAGDQLVFATREAALNGLTAVRVGGFRASG